MELEIQSKTNNPLMNRTEVHFVVHHKGEGTPKRELIRGELAEKLNAKKENIIVNYMKSSFGSTETFGYAKVFTSVEKAKSGEREHILVRNAVIAAKKPVKEKKPSEKPEGKAEPKEEITEKPEEEKPTEEKQEEKVQETEKPAEGEPTEKPAGEEKATEDKPEEEQEDAEKPKDEQPAEEKKGEP